MKKRLIDANALIDLIDARIKNDLIKGWIYGIISETPTVDAVEVVHGRWITHQEHDPDWWGYTDVHFCCSNCMKESNSRAYNYCPNCGADMRERKGNET